MSNRRLFLLFAVCVVATTSLFAQFTPRKDYVWARDISAAASPTITVDGMLSEAVWAQAESVLVTYGAIDGNPGSGYKITNGTGTPTDSTRAVLKFLVDKTTNTLYIAVIAEDSSIGGAGWENSDGILGGIYERAAREPNLGITLQRDIFISFVDSSAPNATFNFKGGNLPSRGVITAAGTIDGTANIDTNASGVATYDKSWTLEMAVSLDSLGYNANTATTDEVQMCMDIWDADWVHGGKSGIATKAWWGNEWGNNGQGLAARVLLRNDVTVNSGPLPYYPYDLVIPNGANYATPTIDGSLQDTVWSKIPGFNIHYGDAALRATYPTIGKDRSGNFKAKGATAFDAGIAKIKFFFKGDVLYLGADIADKSLNSYVGDDFLDAVQLNINVPTDTLYDKNVHQMAGKRFGVAIDSSASHTRGLWDLTDSTFAAAVTYAASLKPGSTVDDNSDVDAGYTVEMAVDLSKLGYPAGAQNKVVAIGVDYHDYDIATDTSAYRVWWFREWPWAASPAFCVLANDTLLTAIGSQPTTTATSFSLLGNYPNPFNPSTTIRFNARDKGTARLIVYDVLGQKVREMTAAATPGQNEVVFNASTLASGVYYYRVAFQTASGTTLTSEAKIMTLLK
ncbi:MAG: T9SS type A sorting domain-containing protein [Bacteroidota bacterium]